MAKPEAVVAVKSETTSETPEKTLTSDTLMEISSTEATNSAAASGAPESDNTSSEATSEISATENLNTSDLEHTILHPGSFSKDPFLASDETVFVGTKKYNELFTFWQVNNFVCLIMSFVISVALTPYNAYNTGYGMVQRGH